MTAPDDLTRLRHMRDSGHMALRFTVGESRETLEKDPKLVFALLRAIEIVGEVAANVSKPTRDQYPQIPWTQIVAMRNRLIHAYFDVDLDQVWNAVADDIPPLIAQLEAILPPNADADPSIR